MIDNPDCLKQATGIIIKKSTNCMQSGREEEKMCRLGMKQYLQLYPKSNYRIY